MYDPANKKPGRRSAQADASCLGTTSGTTFASAFKPSPVDCCSVVGTVFFLLFNGLMIGATAGHLIQIGYSTTFLTFVLRTQCLRTHRHRAHGRSGAQARRCAGNAGAMTRLDALRANARIAVPLVYGAGALLAAAAFIEASGHH